MTPKEAIERLVNNGYSQVQITAALNERGTSVTQATISRIADGTQNPKYDLGVAIVELSKRSRKRATL